MDSIIELGIIILIGVFVIVLNLIDLVQEFILIKRVNKGSILHSVTSLEIKLTISFVLFELSSLYLIFLLVEKSPFDIYFELATALFGFSILLMTYLAFAFVSKTEKFSKLFKNLNTKRSDKKRSK